MSTAGIFNTSNFPPGAIKPSFSSKILQYMPNGTAPLFAFSSLLPKGTVTNTEHSWFFKNWSMPFVKMTTALPAVNGSAISQFLGEDVSRIWEGMVLLAPTMEQMLVVGIIGNQVSVRRTAGITMPVAIEAGSMLYCIGTAFEESSLRPLTNTDGYAEGRNLTQIFRNTWALSGTAAAIQLQIGQDLNSISANRKEALEAHARDIEFSLMFGEGYKGVHKGQPFRKMHGIKSLIQQYAPENIVRAPSVLTFEDLEAMIDPFFDVVTDQSNSNDRLVFGDNAFCSAIAKLGRLYNQDTGASMTLRPGETKFGAQRYTEVIVGRANLKIMEHPLFSYIPALRGTAFVLDISSLEVDYLTGRETDYKDFNPNANSKSGVANDGGVDAIGGSYLSELTLVLNAPKANGIITGVCEVGRTCTTCVTNSYGSITVDKPCFNGEIAPNTKVVVSIVSLANTVVKVMTTTGIIQVTTDANGNGSFEYTVGTDSTYQFSVLSDVNNVVYSPAYASVCVEQPCKPELPKEPSEC